MKLLVLLACCAAGAPAAAQAVVQSTFDSDLENWTAVNTVAFLQQPAGGNPGGRMFVDPNEGQVCAILAPPKFLGNKAGYVGGTLSFDGNMVGTGGSPWTSTLDYGHVRLTGGGLSAEIDFVPGLPPTSWQTNARALTAAVWGMSEANFLTMMSNLTEIRISVEALFGPEQHAIDNVVLASPHPAAQCTFYNGTGINPADLACLTPPVVGSPWLAQIQMPLGSLQSLIALAPSGFVPPIPNPLGAGEVFVGFSPTPLFDVAVGLHTIPIPWSPSLIGGVVAAQGGRVFGVGGFTPLNGLTLKLGV